MTKNKPLPQPNADSKPFWEGCQRSELLFQRCERCGRGQFYPRAVCVHCGAADLRWERASGHGVVHAWTVVHLGLPAFKEEAPHALVVLDMAEGFRMVTGVVGGLDGLCVGAAGHLVFMPRGDLRLPEFRLGPQTQGAE